MLPADFKTGVSEKLGGFPFITYIYGKRLWNLTRSLSLINIRDKIRDNLSLFVGAGVDDENVREQLEVANGAIVGSYFKGGRTENRVLRDRVKRLVDLVSE